MAKKRILILVVPIVAVGTFLAVRHFRGLSEENPNVVRVSGNIEVTDAEVSFKIGGKVVARPLSAGDLAKAGEVVAKLDSADLAQEVALRKAELRAAEASLAELEAGFRPEEIAQAQASVERAKAKLDELIAGSRPQEIAAAQASVESARVNAEHLKVELGRSAQLVKDSTISQREYDKAKSEYERAQARLHEAEEQLKLIQEGPRKEQIAQARAALKEAEQHYVMLKNGPRVEAIEKARANVAKAKAALGLAETRLGYATLLAPLSGIVLSENVEPGEYVAPGTPVVTIGDLQHVWLRAYINETDLGRVKVGQRVRLRTDTYPGKTYEGRVSFIASEAEFTPKNVQTQKERVKLVYRVKIEVPNPEMELKPGMPADAAILVSQGAT